MGTTVPFNLNRDTTGIPAYAPQFSNVIANIQLSANSEVTLTVPNDSAAYIAVFSQQTGTDLWVGYGGTAIVAPTSSFVYANYEQNPGARRVLAGSTLRFMTPNTTSNVTVSFYVSY